ncbi:MAG: aldo/keto reductase [Halobacteriota archaeon]
MSDRLTAEDELSANGIPMLGLGTWRNTDPAQCAESVRTALELGYRHVDTAQTYGNEEPVGEGLATADVPREDVYLATKVWIDSLAYDDVHRTTRRSLDRLGVDYVDLLYVHWPSETYDAESTLAAFDELYDEGLTRAVGISNFMPEQVTEAVELTDAPIVANQVECHPLLQQRELQEHCEALGVELVAYSPLAQGEALDVPELNDIADKHGVSAAQVCLAWLRQRGIASIPKATGDAHLRDNLDSLELELDDEDFSTIEELDRDYRTIDLPFAPW